MEAIFRSAWSIWTLGKYTVQFLQEHPSNLQYHSRSLDRIYKKHGPIPMDVLKKITYAVRFKKKEAIIKSLATNVTIILFRLSMD